MRCIPGESVLAGSVTELIDDAVNGLCYLILSMARNVVAQRRRINLTARLSGGTGKAISFAEDVVRDRYSRFHTRSITRAQREAPLLSVTLPP